MMDNYEKNLWIRVYDKAYARSISHEQAAFEARTAVSKFRVANETTPAVELEPELSEPTVEEIKLATELRSDFRSPKVEAIKSMRNRTGCSLAHAKRAIEAKINSASQVGL